jgi:hypothetical protein
MLTAACVDASIFGSTTGAQTDGGDIRLTLNADGTGDLPCDLAYWDKSGSKLTLWTTLSSINNTTNTTFYIWWKSKGAALSQPAVGAALGRNAVWAGEWAVHHYAEASGNLIDSTGNGNDFVPQANLIRAAGSIDRVADTTNATNGNAIVGSVPSVVEPGSTAFRLSAYLKGASSGTTAYALCKPSGTAANHPYALVISNTGTLRAQIQLNVGGTPTTYTSGVSAGSIADGNYHWGSLTFDAAAASNRLKTYLDGSTTAAAQQAATNNPIATSALGLHLKAPVGTAGTAAFEYSILGPIRSPEWLATEYGNLSAPGSFVVGGTLTDNGSSTLEVILPLLSRAPTLYAPTLSRQTSGSLTFPPLARSPVLYDPTFSTFVPPTIAFPRLTRSPVLFAPTFARQASQVVTLPRIVRTPALLSPTFTQQAAGVIALPALIHAPTLHGFTLINIGAQQSLVFPRITRSPRVWPMDLTPQVTITQLRDPNPFPPTVPDAIRLLSPELWEYLEYQARTLRNQANKLQSGSDSWPIEYLTLVSATPAYALGSKGRFQHPVFGMIRGVYCRFVEMLPLNGAPVGFVLGASWNVSNDFGWSAGERAAGVLPGAAPADDSYGWIIVEGANLLPMSLSEGVPQVGTELIWSGSGTVSVDAAGVVLGRLVGSTLAAGSFLIGVGTGNGAAANREFDQRITSLSASVEDAAARIETVETALSDGTYAETSTVTSLAAQLGLLSSNLTVVNQAYVTGDAALAAQITGVRVSLSTQIASEVSRATAAEVSLAQSTAAITDQLRVQFDGVASSAASALSQIRVITTDQYSLSQSVLNLSGQVDDPATGLSATADALTVLTTEVGVIDGDLTALTTRTTALETTVNDGTTGLVSTRARLITEESTRNTADLALASRATALETTVNDSVTGLPATFARLVTEESTRSAADVANASRSTALEATVNTGANANATLRSDLTAAATATTAVATRTTTLEATVNTGVNANSTLRTDLTTAAGVGTANASAITALQATVNTGGNANATLRADLTANATATTAVATRATALEATVNTGGNANSTLRSDLTTAAGVGTANASAITALQATVNTGPNANATLRSDLTVAAGVGTANASAITTLNTTVGGHSATLTTYGSSINGLQLRYGIKLDVGGRVVGWEQNNSGTTDDFKVVSSNFKILDPTLGDIPVFQVIGGYVYGNFRMRTAEIPSFNADVDARIAAVPAKLSTGLGGSLTVKLLNGESASFNAHFEFTVTGASANRTLQMQANGSNFGSSDTDSGTTSDYLVLDVTGTITNSSGATQIYVITTVITGSGTIASVAARSYISN